MRILADTATLLSPEEGQQLGLTIVPVTVTINNQTHKEYEEITTEQFLRLIDEGGVPTSSQPAVGDVLEVYETIQDEILFITVGDGLSGGYQTAVGARNCIEDNRHIHVVNSKTLAGPLRYLAKKAVSLKNEGCNMEQILRYLQPRIENSLSFVIPADLQFLKRSGRLTPIAAKIGSTLRLLPVLTQTPDKTRITPVSIKRTWKHAIDTVAEQLLCAKVGKNHLISVCHAGTPQKAVSVLKQLRSKLPNSEFELLELSPALITHGGPGCIVVQAVLK